VTTNKHIVALAGPEVNAIDTACEADRAFFAANPHRARYIRPAFPGEEFGPHVWVEQLIPGVRARRSFEMPASGWRLTPDGYLKPFMKPGEPGWRYVHPIKSTIH
jgi:hypothetical protein